MDSSLKRKRSPIPSAPAASDASLPQSLPGSDSDSAVLSSSGSSFSLLLLSESEQQQQQQQQQPPTRRRRMSSNGSGSGNGSGGSVVGRRSLASGDIVVDLASGVVADLASRIVEDAMELKRFIMEERIGVGHNVPVEKAKYLQIKFYETSVEGFSRGPQNVYYVEDSLFDDEIVNYISLKTRAVIESLKIVRERVRRRDPFADSCLILAYVIFL